MKTDLASSVRTDLTGKQTPVMPNSRASRACWLVFAAALAVSVYIHELGHCTVAWLHGYPAIPTPAKEYILKPLPEAIQNQTALGGIIGSVIALVAASLWVQFRPGAISSSILAGAMTLPGFYTLRFVLAGRGHDGTEFQEAQAALGLSYTGHGLDWLFVSLFVAATVFWFWRARARLTPKLVARLIVAPTRLGLVISDADRIVITNRLAPRQQRYRGFSLAISGDDARGIVKDVAFMSPARGEVTDSYFDWELRFYVGTESLAAIYLASSTFTFEGNEYFGDTGQLKALSGKLLKLTTPPGHG